MVVFLAKPMAKACCCCEDETVTKLLVLTGLLLLTVDVARPILTREAPAGIRIISDGDTAVVEEEEDDTDDSGDEGGVKVG